MAGFDTSNMILDSTYYTHLIALSDAHFYDEFTAHAADRPCGHRRRVRGRARGVAGARHQGRLLGRLHAHAHQPRQAKVVSDPRRRRGREKVANCIKLSPRM